MRRQFIENDTICDQSENNETENNEIENISNEKCDESLFLFSLVLLTGSTNNIYEAIVIVPVTVGQFNFYFKKKLFILPKMK